MLTLSNENYLQLVSDILEVTGATGNPEAEADLNMILIERGIYSESMREHIEEDAEPIIATLDDGWQVNGFWWVSDNVDPAQRVVTVTRGDARRTTQAGNLDPEAVAKILLSEIGQAERIAA